MVISICFLSSSSIAAEKTIQLSPEDKEKLSGVAQNLTVCAGVYDMISETYKATNNPAQSLNTHEIANGAELAGAFLLSSTGIIPDWQNALKYAQNARNSEKTRQAALLEATKNSSEEMKNAFDNLIESLKQCSGYGEIQTELVQKARVWIYANLPKQ
jgi:hypothetical protein